MNKRNGSTLRCNGSEVGQLSRYTIPKKRAASPLNANSMDREQGTCLKKARVARVANPWHFDATNLSTLPIIHHKPTYIPFYTDPQLSELPAKVKIGKIMEHHGEVAKQWKLFVFSQDTQQLFGNPIQGKMFSNGDTEKRKVMPGCSKSDSTPNGDNTYVSRSGRHVRRVLDSVVDNDASDDEDAAKTRQSFKAFNRSRSKKSSWPESDNSPRLINAQENRSQRGEAMLRESQKQSIEDPNESFKHSLNMSSDSDAETLQSPLKKYANSQETNRNSISLRKRTFAGSTPTTTTISIAKSNYAEPHTASLNGIKQKVPGEGEALFRELQKLNVEDQKQQSKDDLQETAFASTKYNASRGFGNSEEVNVGASTSAESAPPKAPNQSNGKKRGPKMKMTDCPICSGTFPTREIEEHASTCGITSVLEIQSNLPGQVQNLY